MKKTVCGLKRGHTGGVGKREKKEEKEETSKLYYNLKK